MKILTYLFQSIILTLVTYLVLSGDSNQGQVVVWGKVIIITLITMGGFYLLDQIPILALEQFTSNSCQQLIQTSRQQGNLALNSPLIQSQVNQCRESNFGNRIPHKQVRFNPRVYTLSHSGRMGQEPLI